MSVKFNLHLLDNDDAISLPCFFSCNSNLSIKFKNPQNLLIISIIRINQKNRELMKTSQRCNH